MLRLQSSATDIINITGRVSLLEALPQPKKENMSICFKRKDLDQIIRSRRNERTYNIATTNFFYD